MGVDAEVRGVRTWALAVLSAATMLGGCDEEEGCLDYRALEVDLYAEQACDDCCVFPALQIQQLPSRVEAGVREDVRRGTPLVRADGDTVSIGALLYFLHDIELEYDDGTVVPMTDTFGFRQNESLDFRLADRSLLRSRPFQTSGLTTGELLREGTVTALRFSFGLPADVADADPVAQNSNSPLFLQRADTLLAEGTLATGRRLRSAFVRVEGAGGLRDSSFVNGPASVPYRLPLAEPVFLRRSFNLTLALQLPVEPLIDLAPGAVTAEEFAAAFLSGAAVIDASLGR